jgi:hypothetical protein
MRFSMGSEPFAEANVERGQPEEGHQHRDEQQVVHGATVRPKPSGG